MSSPENEDLEFENIDNFSLIENDENSGKKQGIDPPKRSQKTLQKKKKKKTSLSLPSLAGSIDLGSSIIQASQSFLQAWPTVRDLSILDGTVGFAYVTLSHINERLLQKSGKTPILWWKSDKKFQEFKKASANQNIHCEEERPEFLFSRQENLMKYNPENVGLSKMKKSFFYLHFAYLCYFPTEYSDMHLSFKPTTTAQNESLKISDFCEFSEKPPKNSKVAESSPESSSALPGSESDKTKTQKIKKKFKLFNHSSKSKQKSEKKEKKMKNKHSLPMRDFFKDTFQINRDYKIRKSDISFFLQEYNIQQFKNARKKLHSFELSHPYNVIEGRYTVSVQLITNMKTIFSVDSDHRQFRSPYLVLLAEKRKFNVAVVTANSSEENEMNDEFGDLMITNPDSKDITDELIVSVRGSQNLEDYLTNISARPIEVTLDQFYDEKDFEKQKNLNHEISIQKPTWDKIRKKESSNYGKIGSRKRNFYHNLNRFDDLMSVIGRDNFLKIPQFGNNDSNPQLAKKKKDFFIKNQKIKGYVHEGFYNTAGLIMNELLTTPATTEMWLSSNISQNDKEKENFEKVYNLLPNDTNKTEEKMMEHSILRDFFLHYNPNRQKRVMCVGHSKGGAIAACLSIIFRQKLKNYEIFSKVELNQKLKYHQMLNKVNKQQQQPQTINFGVDYKDEIDVYHDHDDDDDICEKKGVGVVKCETFAPAAVMDVGLGVWSQVWVRGFVMAGDMVQRCCCYNGHELFQTIRHRSGWREALAPTSIISNILKSFSQTNPDNYSNNNPSPTETNSGGGKLWSGIINSTLTTFKEIQKKKRVSPEIDYQTQNMNEKQEGDGEGEINDPLTYNHVKTDPNLNDPFTYNFNSSSNPNGDPFDYAFNTNSEQVKPNSNSDPFNYDFNSNSDKSNSNLNKDPFDYDYNNDNEKRVMTPELEFEEVNVEDVAISEIESSEQAEISKIEANTNLSESEKRNLIANTKKYSKKKLKNLLSEKKRRQREENFNKKFDSEFLFPAGEIWMFVEEESEIPKNPTKSTPENSKIEVENEREYETMIRIREKVSERIVTKFDETFDKSFFDCETFTNPFNEEEECYNQNPQNFDEIFSKLKNNEINDSISTNDSFEMISNGSPTPTDEKSSNSPTSSCASDASFSSDSSIVDKIDISEFDEDLTSQLEKEILQDISLTSFHDKFKGKISQQIEILKKSNSNNSENQEKLKIPILNLKDKIINLLIQQSQLHIKPEHNYNENEWDPISDKRKIPENLMDFTNESECLNSGKVISRRKRYFMRGPINPIHFSKLILSDKMLNHHFLFNYYDAFHFALNLNHDPSHLELNLDNNQEWGPNHINPDPNSNGNGRVEFDDEGCPLIFDLDDFC